MKPVENFVQRDSEPITPWESRSNKQTFAMAFTNSSSSEASYVDLLLNSPGYTGYKGRGIWWQIYKENCMGDVSNPLDPPGECLEETSFYRIISGMHSNIAALSSEHFFNTLQSPLWSHNLDFFREKLGTRQDWIQNLHMTFSLVLRTVCHVAPVLQECSCDTGSPKEDLAARSDLLTLLNQDFAACASEYMSESIFHRSFSLALAQFQNITRILDCVECEKCRLHGKLKMTALEVALRASGTASPVTSLERNEVTALINAVAYFAESILILHRMELRVFYLQAMWISGIIIFISSFMVRCARKDRKPSEHRKCD